MAATSKIAIDGADGRAHHDAHYHGQTECDCRADDEVLARPERDGRSFEALLQGAVGVDATEDPGDPDRQRGELAVLRRLGDHLDGHVGLAHGVVEDLGQGALLRAHPHDEGDHRQGQPTADEYRRDESRSLGAHLECGESHVAHFPSRRRASISYISSDGGSTTRPGRAGR